MVKNYKLPLKHSAVYSSSPFTGILQLIIISDLVYEYQQYQEATAEDDDDDDEEDDDRENFDWGGKQFIAAYYKFCCT